MSLSVEVSAEGVPEPARYTGEGAIDFEERRGSLTFDMSEFAAGLGGDATAGSGEVEVVLEERVMYMKMPALERFMRKPRPWVRIELDAGSAAAGQLGGLGGSDPTQQLALLYGARDVEELGEEDVRGDAATHYRVAIDLRAAIEDGPEDLGPSLEPLVDLVGDDGLPADVWVDEDGLVRRFVYRYEAGAESGGSSATFSAEYFDFGVEVVAEPPPPRQVADFADLFGPEGAP